MLNLSNYNQDHFIVDLYNGGAIPIKYILLQVIHDRTIRRPIVADTNIQYPDNTVLVGNNNWSTKTTPKEMSQAHKCFIADKWNNLIEARSFDSPSSLIFIDNGGIEPTLPPNYITSLPLNFSPRQAKTNSRSPVLHLNSFT